MEADVSTTGTSGSVGARALLGRRGKGLPAAVFVSLGGGLGALARYALGEWIPAGGAFPWATFAVNASGCLCMGVLMVLLTRLWPTNRVLRPFWGIGFLGGFTTFSAYVVEFDGLLREGAVGTAFGYLLGTALSALLAVTAGIWLGRTVLAVRRGYARRAGRGEPR
ncbi:hypothetical protein GCM10027174_42470 [Salinifilum aidingensis]